MIALESISFQTWLLGISRSIVNFEGWVNHEVNMNKGISYDLSTHLNSYPSSFVVCFFSPTKTAETLITWD